MKVSFPKAVALSLAVCVTLASAWGNPGVDVQDFVSRAGVYLATEELNGSCEMSPQETRTILQIEALVTRLPEIPGVTRDDVKTRFSDAGCSADAVDRLWPATPEAAEDGSMTPGSIPVDALLGDLGSLETTPKSCRKHFEMSQECLDAIEVIRKIDEGEITAEMILRGMGKSSVDPRRAFGAAAVAKFAKEAVKWVALIYAERKVEEAMFDDARERERQAE